MDRIDALEKRLHDLEDERDLRDLLTRYSIAADMGRNQDYVDLYTEDGAIDLTDMGLPRYQGPEALMEFISTLGMLSAITGSHHAVPTLFTIDGDDAVGEGYGFVINHEIDKGTFIINHANFSRWTFRRENGTWKIVERDVKLLGSTSATKLFAETLV
ncbi:hypothetical protein BH09ACT10_BH09ACT10_02070 [soil metagenome]